MAGTGEHGGGDSEQQNGTAVVTHAHVPSAQWRHAAPCLVPMIGVRLSAAASPTRPIGALLPPGLEVQALQVAEHVGDRVRVVIGRVHRTERDVNRSVDYG